MSGAEKLGERLRREVEVEGLSELLASLRELHHGDEERKTVFGIPELDALLPSPPTSTSTAIVTQLQAQQPPPNQHSDDLWDPNANVNAAPPVQPVLAKKPDTSTTKPHHIFPILELISAPTAHTPSGSGKTSLMYLITALAILPPSISTVPVAGQNAAVVIIDPLSHFSASRLAEVCTSLILSKLSDKAEATALKDSIKEVVKSSLQHVHVFRPTSWSDLLGALAGMEAYLFDRTRHMSMKRRVHSIVLEDVDAFYWALRSSSATSTSSSTVNPLTSASKRLTTHLLSLSTIFSASVILTSHSNTNAPSSFRAPIPLSTSWPPNVQVIRLAVKKIEVLKFAPGICVEQAEVEREKRGEVVRRGRFECWKLGGMTGQEKVREPGDGFVFRVRKGVEIEEDSSGTRR